VKVQILGVQSHEVARSRSGEAARGSGPSIEGDACQRSRDLASSGARRVNAQVFGIKSRETRGHEAVKWRGG
jgi:hypothetical protein